VPDERPRPALPLRGRPRPTLDRLAQLARRASAAPTLEERDAAAAELLEEAAEGVDYEERLEAGWR
jgi:hypothetical protein